MKIKNYHQFQHFSKRRPLWIKLYRNILDQHDISLLSDSAYRVLVGLWLLASEDEAQEGNLPDIDTIAFRLRLPKQRINKGLEELKAFVIQDNIKTISKGYQDDTLEKRREETEKEKRQKQFVKPSISEIQEYCTEIGFKQDPQAFLDYYEANGWIVGKNKMKDWKATVRNWQRRSGDPIEAPKRTKNPRDEFDRVLNAIIIDAGRATDKAGFWRTAMDKYKDQPKYNGFHVVDIARKQAQ